MKSSVVKLRSDSLASMAKITRETFIIVALSTVLIGALLPSAAMSKTLNMQTIFASDTFVAQLPSALKWLSDQNRYAFIESDGEEQKILSRAVDAKNNEVLLSLQDIPGLPSDFRLTDFEWRPDNNIFVMQGVGNLVQRRPVEKTMHKIKMHGIPECQNYK